jgi:hypothetical protein
MRECAGAGSVSIRVSVRYVAGVESVSICDSAYVSVYVSAYVTVQVQVIEVSAYVTMHMCQHTWQCIRICVSVRGSAGVEETGRHINSSVRKHSRHKQFVLL